MCSNVNLKIEITDSDDLAYIRLLRDVSIDFYLVYNMSLFVQQVSVLSFRITYFMVCRIPVVNLLF